ncbi:MAG TPA: glutamine amidotransferase, partial [Chthoniobacteraceae bacterium]
PEGVAEATTVNNRSVIVIDRGTGPHRVLYLAGRPNWEYKFLRRAVQEDNETQLVGLIRIARREGKFEFRGRTGESSNPLFRGFDNQSPEEVERYDQPVLVRLETEETNELIGGFPKTAEELFRYRAVIIDDLEAEFFTADQMTLLQRFVSERGGSVLMLGGADSLAEGKYARTPIGEMLPVYLDKSTTPGDGHPLRLSLTREGWLQPWARLRRNEPEEQARLGDLPPFEVLNHTGGVKPAAIVVATVNDGRNDYPALVTQRFGRGRTAALLIGDLWQSGLGHEARQADLGKAWRQLVRWLVADVPERLELQAEPEAGGTLMRLKVRARDTKYRPMENASVVLTVQAPGAAEPIMLEAEASAREPGVFETSYVPRNSGGYRVTAEVKDENGAVVGSARTGWATDLAAAEFRTLIPNRALMENLARGTGGEVIAPDKLGDLVQRLPGKAAPITETLTRPLWHTPWMFFFALGCLITEWGLRRWKGLP